MTLALRAEWTKLRTSPGTAWILLATVVLTAGLSTSVAGTMHVSGGSGEDPTKTSLIGVDLGQAIVAVLGVLVISEEYGTRMIRTTLAAIPRRMTVLASKAVNLIVLTALASTFGVAAASLPAGSSFPAPGSARRTGTGSSRWRTVRRFARRPAR